MERSRRGTLASIAGVLALAGCGRPESAARDEQSTIGADMDDRTREILESSGPTVSAEELIADYDADVYILTRDEQFAAVDDTEEELLRAENLGRAINQAQATLSDGRIIVAATGSLNVPIEQANGISIGGPDPRAILTPADDVGESYEIYRVSAGTSGGQFDSLGVDMQYKGGSAVHAEGSSDLAFDDVVIKNAGEHGVRLSDAESVEIRNSRVESTSKNAVSITGCSDVQIDACEVTGSNHAVYATNSSNVTLTDVTARETEYSAIAFQDYTTNWEVTGCTAVDSASTPFAASTAINGSFVDCVAEGTTNANEGGFEVEYKADNDAENRQNPVVGCSVVSCTARDCNMGFYAREDDTKYDTGTPVLRPRFVDCTATGCDTGLFIGETVREAVIENFDAVDCNTDIVDNGMRTIIDGRSENEGDPSTEGEWFGHADSAAELDVVVEDTQAGTRYKATAQGGWRAL